MILGSQFGKFFVLNNIANLFCKFHSLSTGNNLNKIRKAISLICLNNFDWNERSDFVLPE